MTKKPEKNPSDYIFPLNMNGLQGRMLYLPAIKPGGRQLLVIYGHHALLERWWGLVQNFNEFGAVTMPDLPGFGGMDSFYKIKTKPDLDAFADYLAAFIKLRYKKKKITIAGVSYGFVIATRMLQRYPDLVKQVDFLVGAVGFTHSDDFTFTRTRMALYRTASKVVSWPIASSIFRTLCLNPVSIRLAYARTHNAKHKFAEAAGDGEKQKALMDLEVKLWRDNDVRTHMATTNEFLHLDNCRQQIAIPVWHVYSNNDQYFDNDLVEQHMRIIFSDYHSVPIKMKTHAPSIMADKKASAVLIPAKLRTIMAKH